MDLVWREPFRVRFYEAEPSGRASIPSLCRYMMEAADNHCQPVGMTLAGLRASGRMWVLARFAARFTDLPRRGDELLVETWGSNRVSAIRAYRDFLLLTTRGEVVAEASSLWLILDSRTRRPLRLPEDILQYRHPERRTAQAVDTVPLEPPARVTAEAHSSVRWRDLDANGHANAICHIEWALEAVPLETRREARMTAFDVQFLNEAFVGNGIVSTVEEIDVPPTRCYRHRVTTTDGQALALMTSNWIAV